jgi:hypothetical protein
MRQKTAVIWNRLGLFIDIFTPQAVVQISPVTVYYCGLVKFRFLIKNYTLYSKISQHHVTSKISVFIKMQIFFCLRITIMKTLNI